MIKELFINEYFITWLGCVCAHILSLYNPSFEGIRPFVSKLIPNKSNVFYNWIDFILLPLVGVLLALFLLEPQGAKACFFAGISWSAVLTSINIKQKKDES